MPLYGINRNPLAALMALQQLGGQQETGLPTPPQTPLMFRRPGTLDESPFRSQQPPAPGVQRTGAIAGPGVSGVEGGLGMTRTPGGVGQGGREWAQQRSGFRTPVSTAPYRSTEELYRIGFAPPSVGVAPGARELAQAELRPRIGEEEFERALGQKEREAIRTAEVGMHPSVQREREAAARRATYPAEAQAKGLGLQALYGFLGRQETAGGTVEARRAQRDAAALNTLERAMSAIMEKQDLTPEDRGELNRLRESIELVRRGVFFASDLFDENELDALADLEESFGLEEGF